MPTVHRHRVCVSRGCRRWSRAAWCGIVILACSLGLSACAPTSPHADFGDSSPAWSPAGDSIAFVHWDKAGWGTPSSGVYVIGADGGGRRLLVRGFVRSVAWSPDGRRLAYDTPEGLFVCTSNGDSVRNVRLGYAYFPSWSPDGDSLAFDDISDVWVVPASGGTPRQVTGGRDPEWSPDGKSLLCLVGGPGMPGGGVGIVTLGGALLSRVNSDSNEDRAPAWDGTGSRVAWNRWLPGRSGRVTPQFWIADTSGANDHPLVWGEGQVDWSPDGARLVVSIAGAAGRELTTIRPDGTGLRLLTR